MLPPITCLQPLKRGTTLQNLRRYSSRLNARARGERAGVSGTAHVERSSPRARRGQRPDKHPQLAGSYSSSKAASGRFLPLATVSYGSLAVGRDRLLSTHCRHRKKQHPAFQVERSDIKKAVQKTSLSERAGKILVAPKHLKACDIVL